MVQTPVFLARSSGSSPSEAELGWESEPSEGSWEGKGRCYLNSDRGVKERVTGQGEAPPGHRESQDWGLCLCWAPSLGLRGTEGSWARPVAGPGERRGCRGWGGRAAGDRVGESRLCFAGDWTADGWDGCPEKRARRGPLALTWAPGWMAGTQGRSHGEWGQESCAPRGTGGAPWPSGGHFHLRELDVRRGHQARRSLHRGDA